uniref:DUF8040 domain-containing protein n=1 Tax=Cucumis melo TaxID=3656 RepID=A0A9I9EEC9_CUCME
MDQQTLIGVLTAFTLVQCQILLTLKLLMNNNKRLPHTPSDTRHRIRELAYFRMIHESDLVCRQSTRIDRRTFAILCHLLRNVASLSLTEIVDVEEMIAMFLHVLAHDVKNRIIQWEFVRFGETVSRHFNIVLLAVLQLYEELIKRHVPVTNNCNDQRWNMSTSNRAPRHVWTKEEEGTLVECLMELVSMGGWKSDNGTFRPEGRTGSSGSKRKRGSQRDFDIEAIHLALDQTNEQLRQIAEWPARNLANDNHVRTEFFRILREMPELTSLDRALFQRHLLSRMDDLQGFVLMPEDEREGFFRVLLRDITR